MNLARSLASLLFASSLFAIGAPGVAAADESATLATPVITAKSAPGEDDTGLIALVAGAVTALVPVAIGATIADRGKDDAAKNQGLIIAGAGLALSPLAAHATAGEWKRAAVFSAIPVASEVAIAAFLTARPDAVYQGTKVTRTIFGALFSVDVFIAAVGVVDASFAGARKKERAQAVVPKSALPALRYFAPTVAGGGLGLTLGGTL